MDSPGSSLPRDRDGCSGSLQASGTIRRRGLPRLGVLALVLGSLAGLALWGTGATSPAESSHHEEDGAGGAESGPDSVWAATSGVPAPLVAAECYMADPSASTLRTLTEAIGGLEAVVVGRAEGAFDLVRFDPLDPDRLIASVRSSYGEAQNQQSNELWQIDSTGLDQTPLAPDIPHDFAHFNSDGTITMWVRSDVEAGFAPRTATVLDGQTTARRTTRPVYASRFTTADDAVFALTGNGDYYSRSDSYEQLIVDGPVSRVLDSGEAYEWIDNPIPELLVAYPRSPEGMTAVWDTSTLEPLEDHPVAGRPYSRVAISGDRRTAVGINFEGQMEQIDLATGQSLTVFGSVDPQGIDQPITLNHDGTIAITVDRSGRVSLWWVGNNSPIATADADADAAQPRWVSADYGARSASSVAASGERVALRLAARPREPVSWLFADTNVPSWIAHACTIAGRPLTADERVTLGLENSTAACV